MLLLRTLVNGAANENNKQKALAHASEVNFLLATKQTS